MRWRLRPVSARLGARLGKTRLTDEAVERIEVSPATTRVPQPTLALPETHALVALRPPGDSLGSEPYVQDATVAWRIDDAIIADGAVLGHRGFRSIFDCPRQAILRGPIETIECGLLCTSYNVARFFGHWLHDGLARELLAAEMGLPALVLDQPEWLHERGYRALAGLTARRVGRARVGHLWVVDDSGMNEGRVARIARVRERLHRAGGPKRVFLSRGRSGMGRNLLNEQAVIDHLIRAGFAVLHPESADSETIVRTLGEAQIVVAVEGSAVAHAIMAMPRGATLLIIQPSSRIVPLWKTAADVHGIHFAQVVAQDRGNDDFALDLADLEGTLALVERAH